MRDAFPSSEELDKAVEDYKLAAKILGRENTPGLAEAFYDGAMWMFRNRPSAASHPVQVTNTSGVSVPLPNKK